MKVRNADFDDVAAVVEIHIQAFPGFFLTLLGRAFLHELYAGFLRHPSGILLLAERSGQVIGFAAGTSAPDIFFPSLRRRRALHFLLRALPAVLRNPMLVIRKLYGALFYRGDQPVALENGALLSSIGVLPAAMGQDTGRILLEQFEAQAYARGVRFVYLTTDEANNARVNAFYRKCGYRQEGRFMQQKNRPMLRYVKTAPTESNS